MVLECLGAGEGRIRWNQKSGSRCGVLAPSWNPKLEDMFANKRQAKFQGFDALVREQLSVSVLQTLGSGAPTLRYVLAMLCAAPLAQLPQYLSMGLRESRGRGMGKWLLDWCKFPALALFMFGVAFSAWRKGALWSRAPLCVAIPTLQCLVVFCAAAFWIPYEAVKLSTGDGQFFEAIPLACMWIILVLLYIRLYPSCIFRNLK